MSLPTRIHVFGLNDKILPGANMTVDEAVLRAKKWWDSDGAGRDYFRRARNRKTDGVKDDVEIMARSKILTGAEWDELAVDDRVLIIGYWYIEFCRQEMGDDRLYDLNGEQMPFQPPMEDVKLIEQLLYQEAAGK